MAMKPIILLLYLCAILSATSGQEEFHVTIKRSIFNSNVLIMLCRDGNGQLVVDPTFFKDGETVSLQSAVEGFVFLFRIDRSMEGNYTCGNSSKLNGNFSSPFTLVGKLCISCYFQLKMNK